MSDEKIEKFVLTTCSRCPKLKVTWMILSQPHSRESLRKFTNSDDMDHLLSFFQALLLARKDLCTMKEDFVIKLQNFHIKHPVLQSYKLSHTMKGREVITIKDLIDRLRDEIVDVITYSFLDDFLVSSHFKDLILLDQKQEMRKINNSEKHSDDDPTMKQSKSLNIFSSMINWVISINHPTYLPLKERKKTIFINENEIKFEWIKKFLAEVHNLPIGVFLASTVKDNGDFPILHVNTYYKKMIGLKDSELIGKSCTDILIHSKHKNSKTIRTLQQLKLAQSQQLPMLQALNCFNKKHHYELPCVIGFKPIFSYSGDYLYIVGILMEEQSKSLGLKERKLVHDLLCIIPDFLQ